MDEFLTGECPHCGQAIEFPSDGNGQTVNCPTCEEPFVLKPSLRSEPEMAAPPAPPIPPQPTLITRSIPPEPAEVAPAVPAETTVPPTTKSLEPKISAPAKQPEPTLVAQPAPSSTPPITAQTASAAKSKNLPPFEQACLEFERDPQFAARRPTRDQIARAWAMVKMRAEHHSDIPRHGNVVVALKEIFKEFRSSKPDSSRQNPDLKKRDESKR